MSFELTPQLKTQSEKLARRYGRTAQDREDIRARCMLAAWRATQKKDSRPDAGGYIYRAMQSAAIDHGRDSGRYQTLVGLGESVYATVADPSGLNPFRELLERGWLEERLRHIEPRDRELIRMLAREATTEEICLYMKVTPKRLRGIIHRKRKVWWHLMMEDEDEQG